MTRPDRKEAPVAQKIQTQFTDDLDGSQAEGHGPLRAGRHPVRDRADRRARPGAAGCAGAPWPGGAADRGRYPAARPGRAQGAAGRPDSTEVREWAKAQGIEVKDRGWVPAEVLPRFKAATGQQGPDPGDINRRLTHMPMRVRPRNLVYRDYAKQQTSCFILSMKGIPLMHWSNGKAHQNANAN